MTSKRNADMQGARGTTSSVSLPAPAVSYVSGVIGVVTLASLLTVLNSAPTRLDVILAWAAAALVGELMVFSTATGRAHVNLATTVHLAMVLCLGSPDLVAVMWLSRTVAKFIFDRKVWYRALFNVAQATGAALAASAVYQLLGGRVGLEVTLPGLLELAPAFLAAVITYYVINTGIVSGIVAATSSDSVWRAWRENYGYLAEIAGTAALAFMAPVTVLCYHNLGWAGLLVFMLPALCIRAISVRYIALRKTQQDLIRSERLAAKGEIAAEVGHEINNYLTVVRCQLHLLLRKCDESNGAETRTRLNSALDQLGNIENLSTGLVDFSCRDSELQKTPLSDLVTMTVNFLTPQRRFDEVDIKLELDPHIGEIDADPGQMQQVLMNLMINAANVMAEAGTPRRRLSVWTRLHDVSGQVEICVADSGPGMPETIRHRAFEPGFTTRVEGHGFGLSTVHRIIANHGGRISFEDSSMGGALLRITLPLKMENAA